MTRRTWDDLTKGEQDAAMAAFGRLAGDTARHPALGDSNPEAETLIQRPNLKRQRHEHQAGVRLRTAAARTWWGRHLRHHPQEVQGQRAGADRRQAGQQAGWPDYTLLVPWGGRGYFVLAALELKRADLRPKRAVPDEWWLAWGEELDADRTWELRRNPPEHYGLTAYQAICLWELAGCGFATRVAYGSDEAFEWLAGQAGER